MNLDGVGGRSVRLDPVAYEFPDTVGGPDWVVVDGEAASDGGHWQFRGAALLPSDCADLSTWLDEVSTGGVVASKDDDDPSLTFLEPSLAFSVAFYDAQLTGIRVHLTHWFSPPWLEPDEVLNTYTHFVELAMAPGDLRAASAVWLGQASAFPKRS